MNFGRLIFRNVRFHARSHFGVFLGATIGSAILIGALAVGDSVRQSLRQMALARLGKTQFALMSNERLFRSTLNSDIDKKCQKALLLPGSASTTDNSFRVNKVQIIGVDETFLPVRRHLKKEAYERALAQYHKLPLWEKMNRFFRRSFLGSVAADTTRPENFDFYPSPGNVYINESLAQRLGVTGSGETILLRVQKPSFLSREVPISSQENSSALLRLRVYEILCDSEFGNFSLQANQTPPFNAFVSLEELQDKLSLPSKANLLLSQSSEDPNATLQEKWQLADAQLELRDVKNESAVELRSERIFLDEPVVRAAEKIKAPSTQILTYFVNELRTGTNTTPYSMVTAANAPIVPNDMRDDEMMINQWLADDLQAKPGDQIALRYFILGESKRLEEKTNSFRVHSIVPIDGVYADRTLMPEFPGIAKAEKTEQWDAGFPLDMKRIRAKDEKYWHDFRGTPKAFVTISAGKKMWANRFGDLTTIRFHISESSVSSPSPQVGRGQGEGRIAEIESELRKNINPAELGLSFQPVREQALAAVAGSEDFGGLFIGFSFFLIIAALILMGLLFQFSLEQRATETGTLLALGFRPKQVRRILLAEGTVIALAGGIVGTVGGLFYAKAMLHGLTTIWRDAVGTSSLTFFAAPITLLAGLFSSVIISVLTIFFVLRKQTKRTTIELLNGGSQLDLSASSPRPSPPLTAEERVPEGRERRRFVSRLLTPFTSGRLTLFCGISAIGLLAWAIAEKRTSDAETFFSAGSLLLIAGITAAAFILKRLLRSKTASQLTVTSMGVRNATRRRKRSLATISLLASGSFLIVAVSAFHLENQKDTAKRNSGTGGFALLGETAFPVVQNLNEPAGRDFFGLDQKDLQDVSFVPFRVREGDDASCLNLNRAQQPRVLGVNARELADRGAFIFSNAKQENPWLLLKGTSTADEIPAIGDAASIQWAMHKKVGDAIDYTDDHGNKFKLRLVASLQNSILQGSLIVDEAAFLKKFPSESGYRMFLVDVPSKNVSAVSEKLSRALRDVGLDLTPTGQRLAQLNAVQNTYLSTFQILGGLGLLLGSAGLGVVVLRNVLERRGEMALLLAVGFRKRALRWMVLSEHAGLLLVGLFVGIVAAIAAILPNLISPSAAVPVRSLLTMLLLVFTSGLTWTWLAARIALRGEILKALRNE